MGVRTMTSVKDIAGFISGRSGALPPLDDVGTKRVFDLAIAHRIPGRLLKRMKDTGQVRRNSVLASMLEEEHRAVLEMWADQLRAVGSMIEETAPLSEMCMIKGNYVGFVTRDDWRVRKSSDVDVIFSRSGPAYAYLQTKDLSASKEQTRLPPHELMSILHGGYFFDIHDHVVTLSYEDEAEPAQDGTLRQRAVSLPITARDCFADAIRLAVPGNGEVAVPGCELAAAICIASAHRDFLMLGFPGCSAKPSAKLGDLFDIDDCLKMPGFAAEKFDFFVKSFRLGEAFAWFLDVFDHFCGLDDGFRTRYGGLMRNGGEGLSTTHPRSLMFGARLSPDQADDDFLDYPSPSTIASALGSAREVLRDDATSEGAGGVWCKAMREDGRLVLLLGVPDRVGYSHKLLVTVDADSFEFEFGPAWPDIKLGSGETPAHRVADYRLLPDGTLRVDIALARPDVDLAMVVYGTVMDQNDPYDPANLFIRKLVPAGADASTANNAMPA